MKCSLHLAPLLWLGNSWASPARAQDPEAAFSALDATELRALLEENQPRAQRWWWTWLGTYSALTVTQGALAAGASTPDLRTANLIGGAGSVVGALNLVVSPYPGRRLRAKLALLETDAEVTSLFERVAAAEAMQTGIVSHLGGFVVSAAPAAVLWFGYDLRTDATINLVGGLILSEAQILSSPRRVLRASRAHEGEVVWWVAPQPNGLAIAGFF